MEGDGGFWSIDERVGEGRSGGWTTSTGVELCLLVEVAGYALLRLDFSRTGDELLRDVVERAAVWVECDMSMLYTLC